jgi:hypothetical protein
MFGNLEREDNELGKASSNEESRHAFIEYCLLRDDPVPPVPKPNTESGIVPSLNQKH